MFHKLKNQYMACAGLILLFTITLGYSISLQNKDVAKNIAVNAKAEAESSYKVGITDINTGVLAGQGEVVLPASHHELSATFHASLYEVGDSVTFEVMIKNDGTKDAILKNIKVIPDGYDVSSVLYQISGVEEGKTVLASKKTNKITVKILVNPDVVKALEQSAKSFSVEFNYEEK